MIGGTVTGQEIDIVARNADASWFQLDNGGWVSAGLVAARAGSRTACRLPPKKQRTSTTPSATPTPLPTPAAAPTTRPSWACAENLYVIRVDGTIDGYDSALTKIDDLITQGGRPIPRCCRNKGMGFYEK